MSDIVFPSVLKQLLDEQYSRNRRKLATAVGVTESALSQYLRGESTPKLRVLTALAWEFNVSLDFLVYGVRADSDMRVEAGGDSLAGQPKIADAMRQAARDAEHLTSLTREIGNLLAREVAVKAREVAGVEGSGLWTPSEIAHLEENSKLTRVVTDSLAYDKAQAGQDASMSMSFLEVIAKNIEANHRYEYVVTDSWDLRDDTKQLFRQLSQLTGRPPRDLRPYISFMQVPDGETVPGFVIYSLNEDQLSVGDTDLGERVKPWVWLSPHDEVLVGAIEPHGARQPFQLVEPQVVKQLEEKHARLMGSFMSRPHWAA